MTVTRRRWVALLLAPLVAAALVVDPGSPAAAEPAGTSEPAEHKGNDGKTPELGDVLESSTRRFVQAKGAVAKSTAAQKKLNTEIATAEARRDKLLPEVDALAAQQYRTGRIGPASLLLGSGDSDLFLDRAVSLNELNRRHDGKLRELNAAVETVASRKAALAAEVAEQKRNLTVIAKQRTEAQKAFALVGGNAVTQGLVDATSAIAKAAPRNANGGFDTESCSVDDPTNNGCVRPRTMHMYKEVKKAGFDRFVNCYRPGGPFEHPKGLACDWALQKSGFSNYANNDQLRYGNDLMAFAVRNADRLGIYYVIWNRKIWFPATGWKGYSGPSPHTDHVHISML